MATVDVLIKGYETKTAEGKDCYSSTTTLIKSDGKSIVVDPGQADPAILIIALEKHGLKPEDIDYVFLTHSHLDHSKNTAIFPNAKVVDAWGIRNHDIEDSHGGDGYELLPQVKIITTPGHSHDHASLLVETDQGRVLVGGDLYWHSDFTPAEDPYAWDQKELEKSRRKALAMADFLIPGHDDITKIPDEQKN